MYQGLRKVLEMSNDNRITDTQFRLAIKKMSDWKYRSHGMTDGLDMIHREAVMDSERDRYYASQQGFVGPEGDGEV